MWVKRDKRQITPTFPKKTSSAKRIYTSSFQEMNIFEVKMFIGTGISVEISECGMCSITQKR